MKLTSKFLMIMGIFYSFISTIRYYFIYSDLDRWVAYSTIGGIIFCIGWVHSRLQKLNDENIEQWNFMDKIAYGN